MQQENGAETCLHKNYFILCVNDVAFRKEKKVHRPWSCTGLIINNEHAAADRWKHSNCSLRIKSSSLSGTQTSAGLHHSGRQHLIDIYPEIKCITSEMLLWSSPGSSGAGGPTSVACVVLYMICRCVYIQISDDVNKLPAVIHLLRLSSSVSGAHAGTEGACMAGG